MGQTGILCPLYLIQHHVHSVHACVEHAVQIIHHLLRRLLFHGTNDVPVQWNLDTPIPVAHTDHQVYHVPTDLLAATWD